MTNHSTGPDVVEVRIHDNAVRMFETLKAVLAADKIGPESMRAALVTAREIVEEIEPCVVPTNAR